METQHKISCLSLKLTKKIILYSKCFVFYLNLIPWKYFGNVNEIVTVKFPITNFYGLNCLV